MFLRMVGKLIRTGDLTIRMPDGTSHRFGDNSQPRVTLRFDDPGFGRKFLINPELAIGEAYMDGRMTIDGDDLYGFFRLALSNIEFGIGLGFEGWVAPLFRRLQQFNPIGRARRNVAHHYDLSGELYDLFLDEDKQYSCAYFRSPNDTLEQAQVQKKAHIAAKLLLQPDMRVLDIGCGWGGMALTLAQDYGARVVGVTLSEEQLKVGQERVRAAGLQDRIDLRLQDYRTVAGPFDRIVSVGMFEHVGVPHYREYFRHVHDLLTDDGVALIHTIGRGTPPGRTSPWIAKYIFPGGYVPAMSEMAAAVEHEGLWATDIEVWRLHYAETLKAWHDRFMARRDAALKLYDERFCRMWRYYLVASEMAFRMQHQVVFQVQLAKQIDNVPITRDYIHHTEEQVLRQAAE